MDEILEKAGGPLPQDQALKLICEICDALSYLHDHQPPVIHRDIKPSNIRITQTGHAVRVDFGLSKLDEDEQNTSQGARGHTPGYAPPEQYGASRASLLSDIYFLGATLFTLLTYQWPPDVLNILIGDTQPPKPIHELNKTISKPVSDAVVRAMKIRPIERLESAIHFKDALITQIHAQPFIVSVKPIIVSAPTVIESNLGGKDQEPKEELEKSIVIQDSSTLKPTIETKFHIDFEWWKKHGPNWENSLHRLLCPEHKESSRNLEWGQVDPLTGERVYKFNIRHVVMTHCVKRPNFLSKAATVIPEAVFRFFLINGNAPMSAEELGSSLHIHSKGVLQGLVRASGSKIYELGPYNGISPYLFADLFQPSEIRTGIITRIDPNRILVSIGTKFDGVISGHGLEQRTAEELDTLRVEQEVQVFVVSPKDASGKVILSLKRAKDILA